MDELLVPILALILLSVLGPYIKNRHEKWKRDIYTKGWMYASHSLRTKKETYSSLEDAVRLAHEMGIFDEYHRGIENYLSITPPFKRLEGSDENIIP